jgi:putative ABC transport system permease protein
MGAFVKFFRNVGLALRAIERNGLRSVLTIVGIMIGVVAVVLVAALGSGARAKVLQQVESFGSNFIIVFPQSSSASGARGRQGTGARLTEEDGRAILRESVSIAHAAPVLRARAQVVFENKNVSTSIVGSTTAFFDVRDWQLTRGEAWTSHDEAIKAKVCLIGSTVRDKLFPNVDPVGRTVRIGRYPFRVLGVLASKGEAPFGGDQDDMVLMPIGSMRARIFRTPPGFAGVLMLSANSAETTDRAVAQVESILKQRHRIPEGKNPDFVLRTQKEFQKMQMLIYGILTILLVGIAGISLVVGGIGIMNIMLVSVAERTREIGIRMAIGAREADIQSQFLIEAIVLSLFGGGAGVLLGMGGIWAMQKVLEWPLRMDPTVVFVSVLSSALTGVVFGFFPARRAATLDPIEALRHE